MSKTSLSPVGIVRPLGINAFILLIFNPIFYTPLGNLLNNKRFIVVFKKKGSKITFLATLNAMDVSNVEENKNAICLI